MGIIHCIACGGIGLDGTGDECVVCDGDGFIGNALDKEAQPPITALTDTEATV